MIRYKVVKLISSDARSCYARGKYRLTYKKNTIVTAEKNTLGIAVFERKYQAEDFLTNEFSSSPTYTYQVIRVNSIGRGKRYRFVHIAQDEWNLDNFYHIHTKNLSALLKATTFEQPNFLQSPPGTIFYQQVEILE